MIRLLPSSYPYFSRGISAVLTIAIALCFSTWSSIYSGQKPLAAAPFRILSHPLRTQKGNPILRKREFVRLKELTIQPRVARTSKEISVRVLDSTLTTTACPNIRSSYSFKARLQLLYLYQIEGRTKNPDLSGIEQAIATTLAAVLNQCDSQERPANAVQIFTDQAHEISPVSCNVALLMDNSSKCQVVRGITSVLLDQGASEVTSVSYSLIQNVLSNVSLLNDFATTSITNAVFVRRIGVNLVLFQNRTQGNASQEDGTTATLVVILASSLLAFCLACICFFLVWSRRHLLKQAIQNFSFPRRRWTNQNRDGNVQLSYWQYGEDNCVYWSSTGADSSTPQGGPDIPDDDGSSHHAWMMATLEAMRNMPPNSVPILEQVSPVFAVSDLTSDSESIKSSLKMDSIKEEEDDVGEGSFEDELVMAELAQEPLTPNSPSQFEEMHQERSDTDPDDNEEEVIELPAFTGAIHYYNKEMVDQVLSEAAYCLSATYKESPYYISSDSDADTPVRSNLDQRKTEAALGDSFVSETVEVLENDRLLLPNLDGLPERIVGKDLSIPRYNNGDNEDTTHGTIFPNSQVLVPPDNLDQFIGKNEEDLAETFLEAVSDDTESQGLVFENQELPSTEEDPELLSNEKPISTDLSLLEIFHALFSNSSLASAGITAESLQSSSEACKVDRQSPNELNIPPETNISKTLEEKEIPVLQDITAIDKNVLDIPVVSPEEKVAPKEKNWSDQENIVLIHPYVRNDALESPSAGSPSGILESIEVVPLPGKDDLGMDDLETRPAEPRRVSLESVDEMQSMDDPNLGYDADDEEFVSCSESPLKTPVKTDIVAPVSTGILDTSHLSDLSTNDCTNDMVNHEPIVADV